MSTEILLCLSNEIDINPYKFKFTNCKVYSFEEAVYHVYINWKYCFEDIETDEFINWVKEELCLTNISIKLKKLITKGDFNQKLFQFFSLSEFSKFLDLKKLEIDVLNWEEQFKWQKLKEQGDYLVKNSEFNQAIKCYFEALEYDNNKEVLNNLGIAYMYIQNYKEAKKQFELALNLDEKNLDILFNLIESTIYSNELEKSSELLNILLETDIEKYKIYYLFGELNVKKENLKVAINYYESALNLEEDLICLYHLCDTYIELRNFVKAIDLLKNFKNKEKGIYLKLSEVYIMINDITSAINNIKEAIDIYGIDCELMTNLAIYYRQDYNLNGSMNAIKIAIELSPYDKRANIEFAKIKKNMGSVKDYQEITKGILDRMKNSYLNNI